MKNSFLMLVAMVVIGMMWTNGAFAQALGTTKTDAAEQAFSGSKAGDRKVLTIKGVEYAFRWCPAGTFMMGSPESEPSRNSRETQHRVTLTQGFWMLETEVTQEMWESVMGNNPSEFTGKKLPVEKVSWNDCQEFITKLNDTPSPTNAGGSLKFSLPTESQWEYACRAGTTTPFHFGSVLNGDKANCAGDSSPYGTPTKGLYLQKTTPFGSYPANAWGLYDMHGNLWEWCEDWYGGYPDGAVTDPVGSPSGTSRVCRGGSWGHHAENCRSSRRGESAPSAQITTMGFRLSGLANTASMPSRSGTNVTAPINPANPLAGDAKVIAIEVFRRVARSESPLVAAKLNEVADMFEAGTFSAEKVDILQGAIMLGMMQAFRIAQALQQREPATTIQGLLTMENQLDSGLQPFFRAGSTVGTELLQTGKNRQ